MTLLAVRLKRFNGYRATRKAQKTRGEKPIHMHYYAHACARRRGRREFIQVDWGDAL